MFTFDGRAGCRGPVAPAATILRRHLALAAVLIAMAGATDAQAMAGKNTPIAASDSGGQEVADRRGGATGTVTTGSGAPVAGAMIVARSLDTPAKPIPEIAVLTGPDGEFRWPLRPGRYELTAMLDGRRSRPGIVDVPAGSAARIDLVLDP